MPPSTTVLRALHQMWSSSAVILLAAIPDLDLYLCRNTENLTWDSQEWTAFPFDVGTVKLDSEGEIPELTLRIHDVGGTIEDAILDNFDDLMGATVTVHAVYSGELDEDAIFSFEFQVRKPRITLDVIDLALTAENPMYMAFPPRKMHAESCQYHEPDGFKGARCGYAGAVTTCDRKFATCISYSNVARFGGQPGLIGSIQDDV